MCFKSTLKFFFKKKRWSLGTLIYEMLTGLPPFYSQNINIMYQKILNGELRFPSYVTGDAQHLLEGVSDFFFLFVEGALDLKMYVFFFASY